MRIAILLAVAAVAAAAPQVAKAPVPIVSQSSEANADGSYSFSYETGDGVKREESGKQKQLGPEESGQTSQGRVTYTAPDGTVISLSFVADENGYQPTGSHLPTPPPVPEHVVKLLDTLRLSGKL